MWLRRAFQHLAIWWVVVATAVESGSLPLAAPGEGRSFDDRLHEARTLLEAKEPEKALEAFENANDLRDGRSADCLLGAAGAYLLMGRYEFMLASADKALHLAGADASHLALAHSLRGLALMKLSGGTNRKMLADAETELRKSLEEKPDDNIVFTLGVLLLKMHRDEEGVRELQDYLDRERSGPIAEMARRLIEDPRRSGGSFAPPVTLTLSDGRSLSLDDLKGHVVLLDFWASWCGPCRAALPSLRSLAERHAGEPFSLVAISADTDEKAWREFIDRSEDDWPQSLDLDGKVRDAYGVKAFPTYVVIDPDGIVRARITGWRPDVAREVDKALEIAARTAAPGSR